jgi:hypothetical protein
MLFRYSPYITQGVKICNIKLGGEVLSINNGLSMTHGESSSTNHSSNWYAGFKIGVSLGKSWHKLMCMIKFGWVIKKVMAQINVHD